MLNRDQIAGASDISTTDVPVPEWGGAVRLSVMTGAARDALQTAVAANKSPSYFEAALIVSAAVDEAGKPIFTGEDIPLLQGKSSAVLSRVARVAMDLNKIGVKAADAEEKNSEASQSDDSGTDSPSN